MTPEETIGLPCCIVGTDSYFEMPDGMKLYSEAQVLSSIESAKDAAMANMLEEMAARGVNY